MEGSAEQSMNSINMSNNQSILDDLLFVRDVLKEKGYNPVYQFTGYILGNDPTYIPESLGARERMSKMEPDEILEELVIFYLNAPGRSELKDHMRYFSEYSVKAGKNSVNSIVGRMLSGDPTYVSVAGTKLSYKDKMKMSSEKFYEAVRALRYMDCDEALIEMLNEFFSMNE